MSLKIIFDCPECSEELIVEWEEPLEWGDGVWLEVDCVSCKESIVVKYSQDVNCKKRRGE